jgi:bifunctional non-homologous end joining protein LigD
MQVRIENGDLRLLTRTGLDWTGRFAGLAAALRKLKVDMALIDGEVIVENERGISSFADLVDDLAAGRFARMIYVAFDLLYLNDASLLDTPLGERKALLEVLLQSQPRDVPIRFSEHIAGPGSKLAAEACKLGLEGIISKRIDMSYRPGRGNTWLKTKCVFTDEFVIAGYVDATDIKNAVGALALGYYEGDRLIYAGRVGTGFNRRFATDLWERLQPLRTKQAPLASALTAIQRRGVIWVRPDLVAQVDYRARTRDGLLRQAAFKALREDKPAKRVHRPDHK